MDWPCGLLTKTPIQAKEAWTSGLESKEDPSQGLLENREERRLNSEEELLNYARCVEKGGGGSFL